MKLFTQEEVAIIAQRNTEDLGALAKLTPLEILQLKAGENVTLGAVVRARAILSAHFDGKLLSNGYVSRAELDLVIEEHNNLAAKMMLIFEALVRRNLITENDLFALAAEMRGDTTDGKPPSTTGRPRRKTASACRSKKSKAVRRSAGAARRRVSKPADPLPAA